MFFQFSNAQEMALSEKERAEKQFENDLKNNQLKVYVQGGIVSALKKDDLEFAKQHQFYYHEFGCLAPPNPDFYATYNEFVFNYLDKKFNIEIRKEVNKSSLGIQKV